MGARSTLIEKQRIKERMEEKSKKRKFGFFDYGIAVLHFGIYFRFLEHSEVVEKCRILLRFSFEKTQKNMKNFDRKAFKKYRKSMKLKRKKN